MTRQLLPQDLAAVAESVIGRVTRQLERRRPKDIGRWLRPGGAGAESAAIERTVSPEDLVQESARLILKRMPKLPTAPAGLEAYLYPKIRKAAQEQVTTLAQPVRVPRAEQKVLALQKRIDLARERDPRFALTSASPAEIFMRLAKDPGFASLLRRYGGKRYFGTTSGVERTMEAGLPGATRESRIAKAIRGEHVPTPGRLMNPAEVTKEADVLRGLSGETPLDALLAKQAESFTGPMARMELALRALTERQREIVTRSMGLGRPAQSLREIADEMKIHFTTVREHYQAGMKNLTAALKPKRAPAPKAAAPVPAPKTTAKELVEERLREAWRHSPEARRRWEVIAPIRRMREQPPVRIWRPGKSGEAVIPTGTGKGIE
jgi:hypothetical protein